MMNNLFYIFNVRNSVEGMKDLNGYVTLSFHISQIESYRSRTEKTLANQKKRKY